MQKLSPSQVRRPPLTPTSYKGANVEAGFIARCAPSTTATLITLAIITFDLVTDWLAWKMFQSIDFGGRVRQVTDNDDKTLWGMHHFYHKIPYIYLALCILSSIVNFLEATRLIILLATQRNRFKRRIDGLDYNESHFEKFGGEIILVFQTLLQDFAISCLLLAVQAAIGCSFVIPFNRAIFGVSMIATCISVIWKLGQVVWNSGCLGRREKYLRGRLLTALRIITLLLLVFTLAIVTLNLLVFISKQQNYKGSVLHSALFDKIGMDHWIEEDHLALMVMTQDPSRDNRTQPSQNANEPIGSVPAYANVVRLKDIMDKRFDENQTVTIRVPCDTLKDVDIFMFFQDKHRKPRHQMANCSVLFRFSFSAQQRKVTYNYMYTYVLGANRQCVSDYFLPFITKTNRRENSSPSGNGVDKEDVNQAPSDPTSTGDNQPNNSTIGSIFVPQRPPPPPPQPQGPRVYLKLGYQPVADNARWVRCMFDITMNTTTLPLSPCA